MRWGPDYAHFTDEETKASQHESGKIEVRAQKREQALDKKGVRELAKEIERPSAHNPKPIFFPEPRQTR